MTTCKKPCSKHSKISAVSYCKTCGKYMCVNCEKVHKELSDDKHGVFAIVMSDSTENPCLHNKNVLSI